MIKESKHINKNKKKNCFNNATKRNLRKVKSVINLLNEIFEEAVVKNLEKKI